MDEVAAALLENPLFRGETERGARVTGPKVREKYYKIMKACRDADHRAAFVSGFRGSEFSSEIVREIDEAINHDDQAGEDRARLRAGANAEIERKDRQGDMVSPRGGW